MTLDKDGNPLWGMNPTGRFSNRAEDYARYRPTYPAGAVDAILRGMGDPSRLVAADVGAGNGISARLLGDRGVRVIAIEPNAEMRRSASAHTRVEWREGEAEATGMASGSVDLVQCAQAFHWFRQLDAVKEFHRILRSGGRLALMWNNRDSLDPVTRGYIEAIHEVGGEHPAERKGIEPGVIEAEGRFTAPSVETFQHWQDLDCMSLVGRALSASYVPREGEPLDKLKDRLVMLFKQYKNQAGLVRLMYLTKVYVAERR